MKRKLMAGSTGIRMVVNIRNSATGGSLTGINYASSGLKWSYFRDGDTSFTSIVPVNATVGTYTSAGFKEINNTGLPGFYEIGVPNQVLASGANAAVMKIWGALDMEDVDIEIELDRVDYQNNNTFGLTFYNAFNENVYTSGGLYNIVDNVFKRDWTAISGEAPRSLLNAQRFIRNKWATHPSSGLLVYKEDDSSIAWSGSLTTTSSSDFIIGGDPY